MSDQQSRISDEEFERRLNSRSYESQWRNIDERDKSQEQNTQDWLQGQRQQSGQAMLRQMQDYKNNLEYSNNNNININNNQQLQSTSIESSQINNIANDLSSIPNTNNNNNKFAAYAQKLIFPKDLKFEKFIEDKSNAFVYFSNHPKTSNRFDNNDVTTAQNLAKSRNTANLSIYFSVCLTGYYLSKYLKYKNIPWGITYKFSFIGFFTKYFFLPSALSSTVDKYAFAKPYAKNMEIITNKYSFTDDKVFLETFESQQKK